MIQRQANSINYYIKTSLYTRFKKFCNCGGTGSFQSSAACGGISEGWKGAAVEILHRLEVRKISGTARVTRKRGCLLKN